MKRTVFTCLAVFVPVLTVLLAMEILLRIAPGIIGLQMLDRFPARLKSNIANQLHLPSTDDFILVSSAERFDKGHDMYLPAPNGTFFTPMDTKDREAGALEWVTLDSKGFCNSDEESAADSVDVVTIGGSVPSCAAVLPKNIFSHQLAVETGLSIYDLTVGGVGPFEYLEILKRHGLRLHPKAVVMAYAEVNDLRDCERHVNHLKGIAYKPRQQREWPWPFTTSYALSFMKAGGSVLVRKAKAKALPNFRFNAVVAGNLTGFNSKNGDQDTLESAMDLATGRLDPGICEEALKEFGDLGRANGFTPIVMRTPATFEIYWNSIDFETPSFKTLLRNYIDQQTAWLSRNADRLGFVYVDIVAELQTQSETKSLLFFQENTHLTAEGHRTLAETVASEIKAAVVK